MQIHSCVAGQRVTYRENGRAGTIKEVHLDKNEVDLVLDNGMRIRAHARLIDPLAGEAAATPAGPTRPCPQCAAKMPLDATTCPACGFQYGVKKAAGIPVAVKVLMVLIVVAVAGCVIWKFVLGGKLPGQ